LYISGADDIGLFSIIQPIEWIIAESSIHRKTSQRNINIFALHHSCGTGTASWNKYRLSHALCRMEGDRLQQSKSAIYRRNYALLILEGSFFTGGTGFFNAATIIPVFIDMMTGSKSLVGLTITLGSFFSYFCRLLIGPFLPYVKNHARFTARIMFLTRPLTLLPAFFLFSGHDLASVITLVIAYCAIWIADGLVVPPWTEVMANTVDEERHGRLLGTQVLVGGMASIGAGAMVSFFLQNPDINMRSAFGWIFLMGGTLFTVSCIMMAFTENAPAPYKTGRIDFAGYYRKLPRYLKTEKDNTRMLVLQLIFTAAGMGTPFIILFACEVPGITEADSALLILAQSVGIPVGGWLWGQICDRLGCDAGLKLAGVNYVLIAVLPLLAFVAAGVNPLLILIPVMFLAGISNGTWTCYYVYTVQVVRPEARSACMVLSSIVTLPGTFANGLAGFICDRFGYIPLFITCLLIALTGTAFSFGIKPPRTVLKKRGEKERNLCHMQ